MKEHMKKIKTKRFGIILFVLVAVAVTIFFSSYAIFGELEGQLEQNLEDVATQNALALHNKIHSNHELIVSLSDNMHGVEQGEDIEERLQSLEIFLDEYNLKRFAYAFPDGTSYATDGGVANLSYRELFKRGMEGKGSITGILQDALDESHGLVNVMTIPVYDDSGEVEGVFGLTYDSQSFNEALQIECFDGQGYSCAINSDGEIMIAMGSDILQMSENLFTDLLAPDERNEEAIARLQKQMEGKTSGGGTFFLSEKNYYHCVPVNLMDGDVTWYMITIVPADVLESRVAPIQHRLYTMAFVVVLLTLMGVAFVIVISRQQKAMMLRYAYEDPLTKGANYARFRIEMSKKRNPRGYLVSMDITHFNNINIVAGKMAGDDMIGKIWQILNEELHDDMLHDEHHILFERIDQSYLFQRIIEQ